ncbi:MAG TPA: MFS transporter [Dehalococcoidia bacterium]|nr:MFS transporter [Dehalococcoidia bacterium]
MTTGDPEQPSQRSRLGNSTRMLSALKYPQFRRFWFGNAAAVGGQQIMWLAQGVLVYRLTGEAVYIGFVGLATAAPAILLNLVGGVVADRIDQRKIILTTQIVTSAAVGILALLVATDQVSVWHVVAVAFVAGCMQAFNNPARQSIFPGLVERKELMNAVALNSIVWQSMRIVAPGIGGLVLAIFGVAATFSLVCAGFLLLGVAVIGLDTPAQRRTTKTSPLADLKEGIAFISANFLFAFLIGMSFFNSFFGFSTQQLMPVFTEDILHVSDFWLGMLLSMTGVGSIIGIGALGYAGDVERKGLLIIGGATAFGAFIILFALSTYYPLSLLLVGFMGAFGSIYMITVQTTLQLRVPDELRGRVMGIYGITHNVGPLGALQAGIIADSVSPPAALIVGGVAIIVFALAIAYSNRSVRTLASAPAAA